MGAILTAQTTKPTATFKPLPWQVAPWMDKSPTLLLTGGAGGGKSHLALEKMHGFCLKYPGALVLFIRKTRVAVARSSIRYFMRHVVGDDPSVVHKKSESIIEYANGSSIMYGGMADEEQRQAWRSLNADMVLFEEANMMLETDFNEMKARLRGRAAPWRQFILCTNPDSPQHWIKQRLIDGEEASVYYSRASDNQFNPEDYLTTLAGLTGVDAQRLDQGLWVQASGLIYDTWLDGPVGGNVTYDAEYAPDAGGVYWAVDDGYTGEIDRRTGLYKSGSHPRVFLLCQIRAGILHVFAESYAVKKLSDQHISDVAELEHQATSKPYDRPIYAAVDKSAAELKGRMHGRGIQTRNGPSSVEESIKVLHRWLAADENGVRRVLVHPRCKHLRAEMVSLRRDDATGRPIKEFDHGPDALRYLVWCMRYEG